MRKNKHIVSGYRLHHYTYRDALNSLFTIHNESINVWSHLLGAFFFIAIIVFLAKNKAHFKQALSNPLQTFADLLNLEALLYDDRE
jgi:predicted membrane channel-forming protein YqfA (hemolysin III family)